jgi:hypothetical protein
MLLLPKLLTISAAFLFFHWLDANSKREGTLVPVLHKNPLSVQKVSAKFNGDFPSTFNYTAQVALYKGYCTPIICPMASFGRILYTTFLIKNT